MGTGTPSHLQRYGDLPIIPCHLPSPVQATLHPSTTPGETIFFAHSKAWKPFSKTFVGKMAVPATCPRTSALVIRHFVRTFQSSGKELGLGNTEFMEQRIAYCVRISGKVKKNTNMSLYIKPTMKHLVLLHLIGCDHPAEVEQTAPT